MSNTNEIFNLNKNDIIIKYTNGYTAKELGEMMQKINMILLLKYIIKGLY